MGRELCRYYIRQINGTQDKRLCNRKKSQKTKFFCSTFLNRTFFFVYFRHYMQLTKSAKFIFSYLFSCYSFRLSTNFLTFSLHTDESLVLKFKYNALLVIQRHNTIMPYEIGCIHYGKKPAYTPFVYEKQINNIFRNLVK